MPRLFAFAKWFFAVVGVLASILGVFQFLKNDLFDKKSIQVVYKSEVLAKNTSAFGVADFVPNAAPFKTVFAFDFLVWNSGAEPISGDELRRIVSIKFASDVTIRAVRLGTQKAATNLNFELQQPAKNELLIKWKFLDPGDFIEIHLLAASESVDANQHRLFNVDGVLAGNRSINVRHLESISSARILAPFIGFMTIVWSSPLWANFSYDLVHGRRFQGRTAFIRYSVGILSLLMPAIALAGIFYVTATILFWAPLWMPKLI
jgi:hypothetical protein